jgi:hypothetical protein
MEVLQLFSVEPRHPEPSAARARTPNVHQPDDAVWHETEAFLAEHLERQGDLAQIQVALALCDSAGDRDRATLEELALDRYRFPRSTQAVVRVIELTALPLVDRPEGFWPRFLLAPFDEPSAS